MKDKLLERFSEYFEEDDMMFGKRRKTSKSLSSMKLSALRRLAKRKRVSIYKRKGANSGPKATKKVLVARLRRKSPKRRRRSPKRRRRRRSPKRRRRRRSPRRRRRKSPKRRRRRRRKTDYTFITPLTPIEGPLRPGAVARPYAIGAGRGGVGTSSDFFTFFGNSHSNPNPGVPRLNSPVDISLATTLNGRKSHYQSISPMFKSFNFQADPLYNKKAFSPAVRPYGLGTKNSFGNPKAGMPVLKSPVDISLGTTLGGRKKHYNTTKKNLRSFNFQGDPMYKKGAMKPSIMNFGDQYFQ